MVSVAVLSSEKRHEGEIGKEGLGVLRSGIQKTVGLR